MKTTNEYLDILSQYKQNHASEYGIERMGIFGSVARGEQREGSDVDVYYEGTEKGLKSLGMILDLEELFGVKVDVVRKHNNLKPRFVERIMKEMIYV
ncbi:nucleotidyltransferase [Bacteroidia bacterium]|nr:nucleotidyltransferase [Bacteroidia bacterium]GHT29581.1 nucleotidyltransferase [Bacteroidia bacterium]GHV59775.1 nucleotidyltransferase [Bacteroidia bacterium]GHV71009.1 nucleotidyltransferase [Bacteroidia bacterium]